MFVSTWHSPQWSLEVERKLEKIVILEIFQVVNKDLQCTIRRNSDMQAGSIKTVAHSYLR